jgi:hypothetical protein
VRCGGELVQWLLAILATIPKSGVESPQSKLRVSNAGFGNLRKSFICLAGNDLRRKVPRDRDQTSHGVCF